MDFTPILTSLTAQILLLLLAVAFVALVVEYTVKYFYLGYKATKSQPADENINEDLPPISVVIAIHNETEFLRKNLVYILEQNYPNFEVVVVDYLPTEESQFVLKLCRENYPNLTVVNFEKDVNMYQGKKYPLSIGIKSAKNDMIVLTEVESVPAGFNWLRNIAKSYTKPQTNIVLGYNSVYDVKGLFGSMQRYDNLTYNAEYLVAAMRRHPFTGCGHNLSYRKGFFFSKGAFISHYTIRDGADDLFVNQNATGRNTEVCLNKEGHVRMKGFDSLGAWRRYRRRRISTFRYHSFGEKMRRLMQWFELPVFYGTLLSLLLLHLMPWQILLGAFVLKTGWQIGAYAKLEHGFGEKGLCWLSPLYEIYFWLANTIMEIFPLRYKK